MSASVMVPLDGSPLAEQALPLAISLARRLAGHLLLLRVISPEEEADVTRHEQTQQEAKDYLGSIKHTVEKVGVPVITTVCNGEVGQRIVGVANELSISHMVMSTHGRTGLMRWTLGSVTNEVLQLTNQPLFLIRPYPDQSRDIFPLPDIKRIVVALDGSPLAESALPHTRKLARLYEAEILLFQVVSESSVEGVYPLIESNEYLERIAKILHGEGFLVRHESVLGAPAVAIQAYAHRVQADLIVMTTHLREGVGRTILGSITDQVVRLGETAVLVTRPSLLY